MNTLAYYWKSRDENGIFHKDITHSMPEDWLEEVRAEIGDLFRYYGSDVVISQFQNAPCPAWRDERLLHHKIFNRFGLRVHVYENVASPFGDDDAATGHLKARAGRGQSAASGDAPPAPQAGRYLGFLSLRPPVKNWPRKDPNKLEFKHILRAELTPPRRMLRPQYHVVYVIQSALRSGIPNFTSTVYGVADPDELPSTCLHYSISASLNIIMMRFGCYPISERGFLARLWERSCDLDTNHLLPPTQQNQSIFQLQQKGLSLVQALDALTNYKPSGAAPDQGKLDIGGFVASISIGIMHNSPTHDALMLRQSADTSAVTDDAILYEEWAKLETLICIHDLLSNGFPVIINVDQRKLVDSAGRIGRGHAAPAAPTAAPRVSELGGSELNVSELTTTKLNATELNVSELNAPQATTRKLHSEPLSVSELRGGELGATAPATARSELVERAGFVHSTLILGMHLLHAPFECNVFGREHLAHRQDYAELPGRLVVHDAHLGPYIEFETKKFLDAAYEVSHTTLEHTKNEPYPTVEALSMLVLGPKELNLDIVTVRLSARCIAMASMPHNIESLVRPLTTKARRDAARKAWQVDSTTGRLVQPRGYGEHIYNWIGYLLEFGQSLLPSAKVAPDAPARLDNQKLRGRLRYVTRFLGTSEMCLRYFSTRRQEVQQKLQKMLPKPPPQNRKEQNSQTAPTEYWWCVELHLAESNENKVSTPAVVFFWRSRREDNPPPLLSEQPDLQGLSEIETQQLAKAQWAVVEPFMTAHWIGRKGKQQQMCLRRGRAGRVIVSPIDYNAKDRGGFSPLPAVPSPPGELLEPPAPETPVATAPLPVLPEVSLISSWFMPGRKPTPPAAPPPPDLPGVAAALREKVNLLDLYFLGEADVPWYLRQIEQRARVEQRELFRPGLKEEDYEGYDDPLAFAAALEEHHLEWLADALRTKLAQDYQGSLIGPRPRISNLASWWPGISALDETRRQQAVRAVRNTLALGAFLGCSTVEIVVGAGIPDPLDAQEDAALPHNKAPKKFKQQCYAQLEKSLAEILAPDGIIKSLTDQKALLPRLALEIEPGPAFLLNSLESFGKIWVELPQDMREQVWLNVDVAHLMLAGHEAADLRQWQEIVRRDGTKEKICYQERVAHFHLSDHHRTHTADLPPGTFHFYEDYEDWLKLAIEIKRQQKDALFPLDIAIELEACNDIHQATQAIAKTRRWLNRVATGHRAKLLRKRSNQSALKAARHEGIILTLDLGKSTPLLRQGARAYEEKIKLLCGIVLKAGGEVLSFTGDGFIALFRRRIFLNARQARSHAFDAMLVLCHEDAERAAQLGITAEEYAKLEDLKMRVALHYGEVYVPTSGELMNQAIGVDVVVAARLCDFLKNMDIILSNTRKNVKAVTEEFMGEDKADWLFQDEELQNRSPRDPRRFGAWQKHTFKGLTDKHQVYLQSDLLI